MLRRCSTITGFTGLTILRIVEEIGEEEEMVSSDSVSHN
jgi:hypothetical protein